jgi:secreted PhoX family phosphatase
MSHDFDPIHNNSGNEHFQEVLARALENPSRRSILRGGVGLASMMALPMLPGCGGSSSSPATTGLPTLAASSTLAFTAVDKSILDQIILPAGYTAKVLHATGDTLNATAAAYTNAGTETGDSWEFRVGDHHDGMQLFYIDAGNKATYTATNKAVIAMNHESSADAHFLSSTGQTSGGVTGKKFDQFGSWDTLARPGDQVLKEINLHGISVVEVTLDGSGKPTGYNATSTLNRRITPQTVINVAGPAAHLADLKALMVTQFDTTGTTVRGTLNNCGHGATPWGTYLGCEENWAFYFNIPTGGTAPTGKLLTSRQRYGVASAAISGTATTAVSQGWFTPTDLADTGSRFSRWNISASGASAANDFRNEPHTFGYNVEVDPADPTAVPSKRMAMGRFAHEACVCATPVVGQPLSFYMGCDSRNEYIYKFVTTANWSASDVGGGMAAGDKYLNEGKLYVAKFNSDGKGQWLELNISNTLINDYTTFDFANQAEVLVHTRLAADAVGATKMDRPEWGAVNPANGEVYFALTNNNATNRTPAKVDAANPRAYNDPDGRKSSGNPNGHIIRFKETGNLSTATTFTWDIFLFGAEEDSVADVNISKLTSKNSFSSPDGLWFSQNTGICWIQTDDGAFTDETNCMLLASVPGSVGDGGEFVVNNQLTTGTPATTTTGTQKTFVGGILGESRLRRFLVAPKGAEVTGLTETADGKTLFVNIQHPGENTAKLGTNPTYSFESQWPGNGGGLMAAHGPSGRPRSATLMITRTDGGRIGL